MATDERWMVAQEESDSRPLDSYDIVKWGAADEVIVANLRHADASEIVEAHNAALEAAQVGSLPMQPIEMVGSVTRFRENQVVRHLLDHGGIDMNALAVLDFSDEDRAQFAQLIGYSVSGFGDLSYADDETVERADMEAARVYRAAHPDAEGVQS